MNFQVKPEALYYLPFLDDGPSTADCFIITLLGVLQMSDNPREPCLFGLLPLN